MGITLKQIADMAGVHKSTVDKVIHNRPGVSDAKRQQIRALLEEHGYESNPLAKALNYQKKKMTIGVVLPIVNATPDLRRGMELVRQDFNSFNIEIDYRAIDYGNEDAQVKCLQDFRLAGRSRCCHQSDGERSRSGRAERAARGEYSGRCRAF